MGADEGNVGCGISNTHDRPRSRLEVWWCDAGAGDGWADRSADPRGICLLPLHSLPPMRRSRPRIRRSSRCKHVEGVGDLDRGCARRLSGAPPGFELQRGGLLTHVRFVRLELESSASLVLRVNPSSRCSLSRRSRSLSSCMHASSTCCSTRAPFSYTMP